MRILAVAGVLATILAPSLADAGEEVSTSDRMGALSLVSRFDDAADRGDPDGARQVFCVDPDLRIVAEGVLPSEAVGGTMTLGMLLDPELLGVVASYQFSREFVKREEDTGALMLRRSSQPNVADGQQWELFQYFEFRRFGEGFCVAKLWLYDRNLP